MRDDVHDEIDIILNNKIKAPIFVYSGLPKIPRFVVLLGAEGRVVEVQ